jgi:type IX secretion system PorP/SprF family membrane protein
MRKMIVFFTCCWIVLAAGAQQRPIYTQYGINNFIINPALAGIESYWDIKASYRNQWLGLKDAPVTTYLTLQGPLEKPAYKSETTNTVHAPEDENNRGAIYWRNYAVPPAHAGIGFTVINDRTGPLNNFSACGALSYHLPLSQRTELAFGVSAGIQEIYLDFSQLNFGEQGGAVDPAVSGSTGLDRIRPDVNAGLWLYSANYFVGLAAQQIVPEQIGFRNNSDTIGLLSGKLIPNLFAQAGYRFLIDDDVSFLPSFMIRYVQPVPAGFDLNVKFQYRDVIWAGGSWRYQNGFAVMLGLNISSIFNIGYSYEITTTPLNTVSYGTHELVIGFLLGNKTDNLAPRNLW